MTDLNESIFDFFNQHQDRTKKIVNGILSYGGTFSMYINEFLDEIKPESTDRFGLFPSKNVKYLFYRYNDIFMSRSLPTVLVRHSKITENKVVLEELQNTSWQYLVDSVIIATKSKKYLKTTTKREAETMKDTKKMQNITESLQLYIFKHC